MWFSYLKWVQMCLEIGDEINHWTKTKKGVKEEEKENTCKQEKVWKIKAR